jgi:Domain of unknown function DUF29
MARLSKTASAQVPPPDFYERDYYAWILQQASALRERRLEDIDWANVAEEIEDLAKSEKRALKNQLARLFEHLLKLVYARAGIRHKNSRGWEITVRSARREIGELLDESPSLRGKILEILDSAYQSGRDAALRATKLPDSAIPETCPWTFDQIANESFVPEPRS